MNRLVRGFGAVALSAAAVGLNTGCASLNSQNLPSDSCGKAGYVPVKITGNRQMPSTFTANNGEVYGLLSTHDPVAQTAKETALAGGGLGIIAAEAFKFSPVAGIVVGVMAGAAAGRAEGDASYTANVSQCLRDVNAGQYSKTAISYTPELSQLRVPGSEILGRRKPNGYSEWSVNHPWNPQR